MGDDLLSPLQGGDDDDEDEDDVEEERPSCNEIITPEIVNDDLYAHGWF